MQPIAIVGNHFFTRSFAPFDDMSTEIWAFNAWPMNVSNYPRVDMCIQIHSWKVITARYKHQIEWMKNTRLPILMKEKFEDFPTCIPFPFDDVFRMIKHVTQGNYEPKPIKYLTFSIDYALALAILQKRPKISIYGVELAHKNYIDYRPGFTFWTGFAAGRGIKVEIHGTDAVFNKPIYGDK